MKPIVILSVSILSAMLATSSLPAKAAAPTPEQARAQDPGRGLDVVLPQRSVLFASGKSSLLPAARGRLGEIAEALKRDERPLADDTSPVGRAYNRRVEIVHAAG